MTTATPSGLDTYLPRFDASTVQRAVVDATPEAADDAIWSADLLRTPLARILNAAAWCPSAYGPGRVTSRRPRHTLAAPTCGTC
jgi:hypothetical protein